MEKLQQWQRIKEIVGSALERPAAERAAYLDQVCSPDSELRQEVESLLSAYRDSDRLSEAPWQVASPRSEAEPHVIGPYRLLKELGIGGMGQVWLAEQTEPVRRQVALKLIRGGMYDSATVERFKAERQSLAIMAHPAIAKVFDAGTTPTGQPYLVMEYVDGVPITEYCDAKTLSIGERLRLFLRVCEGVQHAHQKAIIHRDLKPSNILVVEVDGKPTPRIIDFGLAKATAPLVPGETLFTQRGAFLGTPGYMSPEQADPEVHDIDTRTDVYSLGAILYELLTGFLPFETTEWKKRRPEEYLRRLREEEPPRPSAKVSASRESTTSLAEARSTEPKQLATLLRGDLDLITMKALEKDRECRYATPSALAADIENYLQNRPVVARPASLGYRTRKYVRRHTPGVAAATAAVVLLVAFAIVQATELRRITRERDRADRITEFMTNMFKVSDPSEARGNTVTAREILDKSAKEIDTSLTNDPQLRAQMMYVMGHTYITLGLYAQAEPLLKRAAETQQRTLGPTDPATLRTHTALGWSLDHEGHHSEAEELLRKTLDLQRRVLGSRNRDTLITMNYLGWTMVEQGRFVAAESLLKETLALDRKVLGSEDSDTLTTIHHLASTLGQEGHNTEAETLKRELLGTERRVLGPEHPLVLLALNNLADTLNEEGRYPEAEQTYRQLHEIQTRVLGPRHPETLWTMRNLAVNLESQGRLAEAEKIYRETLALQRVVLGNEHQDTLACMADLGILLREEGRYEDSEKVLQQVFDVQRRAMGQEHPGTLDTMANLGATMCKERRYTQAEKILRDDVEISRRALGPENPTTLEAMSNLAATLRSEGYCIEAERVYRECMDTDTQTVGRDNPATLEAIGGLGITLSCEKRYAEADELLKRAIETANQTQQPAIVSNVWYSFASAALIAGHREDAIRSLRHAVENGYSPGSLSADPDLKALHADPGFRMLIGGTGQRVVASAPKTN